MGQIIDISSVLLELGLSAAATDEERAIAAAAIARAEGAVKRHLHYDPVQRTRTEYYPRQSHDYQSREGVWEADAGEAYVRRLAEAATSELQVQHIPVRSVTTLAVDHDGRSGAKAGAFGTETEKTEGVDFWPSYDGVDDDGDKLCRDGIIRSAGSWPTTPGTVKIVYAAGYTPEELHGQDAAVDASPVAEAVVDEAVRRARKAFVWKKSATGFKAGPFTSEKLGDYAYTVDSSLANRLFGGAWDLMPETTAKLESFVNYGWMQ